MTEEEKNPIPEENSDVPAEGTEPPKEEKAKSPWQLQKESWYDQIPVNLKQMNIIVTVCWTLMILVFILIFLDAMGIINPFGS